MRSAKQLGGMLRYGIPNYRFPRHLLNAEIEFILSLGIEVHTGVTVGKDIWIEDLQKEYDCLYIAIGAHQDKKTGIPGEDSVNVMSAVEMLRDIGDDDHARLHRQEGGGHRRRQCGHGCDPQLHSSGGGEGHLRLSAPG